MAHPARRGMRRIIRRRVEENLHALLEAIIEDLDELIAGGYLLIGLYDMTDEQQAERAFERQLMRNRADGTGPYTFLDMIVGLGDLDELGDRILRVLA